MSTRSGKRIHKSTQEDPIEDIDSLQIERATRSKKQKEIKVKKKSNYVSYPTEDDDDSPASAPSDTLEKTTRRTRRNTLKEQNVEPVSNIVSITDKSNGKEKKRKSRKIKDPENADVENLENIEDQNAKIIGDDKKKSKKKKNHKKVSTDELPEESHVVLKKKSSKKKNKSTFIVKQEQNENASDVPDRNNVSIDSFHSATHSPITDKITFDNYDNVRSESFNNKFGDDGLKVPNGLECIENGKSPIGDNIKKADSDSPNTNSIKIDDSSKKKRRSSIKNSTFDKIENFLETNKTNNLNGTFDIDVDSQNTMFDSKSPSGRRSSQKAKKSSDSLKLNNIFERMTNGESKIKSLDVTFDKDSKTDLNATFDMVDSENASKKSSLISSDNTINVTYDKSNDNSHISITSDDSKSENILNLTPMLVESSIDETLASESIKTPEAFKNEPVSTPLKREGTFTKDDSDIKTPKPKVSTDKTPVKQKSLPSPGCTPFSQSSSQGKKKSMLNVTRSLEKSDRWSSTMEIPLRQTRVMFCSPANNPAVVTQIKGKVIKSNLKGSNKSFVFNSSVSSESVSRPGRRKRSLTHGDSDTLAKRSRLAEPPPGDRLPRHRTLSAAAKLPEPGSPSKKTTPCKPKADSAVSRTKLPNFAALHQKQFAKMESLDECQARKARRARQLLTPTGSTQLIQRISPNGTISNAAPPADKSKTHTPTSTKLPTLSSLNPGYTKFGFKLTTANNPFTRKETKEKEKPKTALSRQTTCLALPSLAGTTAKRRENARQIVMREKSFTERRDVTRKENRTIIKGVRTNRRFELQMKMRNA